MPMTVVGRQVGGPHALGTCRSTSVLFSAGFTHGRWRYAAAASFMTGGPDQPVPLARSARKGLIVGLGNPKMVIFFLAFFPQFIHPAQGSPTAQMLILGALFWITGATWDLAIACASGTIGTWLERRPRIRAAQPRLEGLAYLGLAGWAAITGSRSDH